MAFPKKIIRDCKPDVRPNSTGKKMPRFKDRKLQLMDIVDRFEAVPSSTHTHNALGIIGRLKDDGADFWGEDSKQLHRWKDYCMNLWVFLNRLGTRKDLQKQELATALREFIQEFEHSTAGMYEMLYGTSEDPDNNPKMREILEWFNLVYRLSTYSLISTWIDDKTEDVFTEISVNLATGERSEKTTRTPMQVPRKYRHRTRKT